MLYLLIIIGVLSLLYFSNIFRNIVRWIIMIPLAVVAVMIYNAFHIVETCVLALLSQHIPYLGFIDNVISLSIDLIIIYLVTGFVAPCKKIGFYISLILSFLVLLYNLLTYASFVFIPVGAEKGAVVNWGETGGLFVVFVIMSFVGYSISDHDD